MFSNQEQFAAATKAHFEAQLQMITALTSKAFEGVEKVIELNMSAAKSSLQELSESGKGIGAAKDPQEFLANATAQLQPNAEKMLDYGRQLSEIAGSLHPELAKAAEAQVAQTRQNLAELLAQAAKNAPPGSENAIAMLQSILGNADNSFDQLMKTTRDAVETMQNNVKASTGQAPKAASKSGKK